MELLACVCSSLSVDSFKRHLDKFWCSQDVHYNYKANNRNWKQNYCNVMDCFIVSNVIMMCMWT